MKATIRSVNPPDYCHAVLEDGTNIYCHATETDFAIDTVSPCDVIEIDAVLETEKGKRGIGIHFVRVGNTDDQVNVTVTAVCADKGFAFGMLADGKSIFLHVKQFADYAKGQSATFDALRRGDLVKCVPTMSKRARPDGTYITLVGANEISTA